MVDVGRRNDVIEGQIVGAGYPADAVGVRLVVIGEPGGNPAANALTYELTAAYDHAEDDDQEDGVATTETVHGVVIVTAVEPGLGESRQCQYHAIHGHLRLCTPPGIVSLSLVICS